MIQELFGRSNVGILGGEKPIPFGGGIVDHGSPSASPSVSSSSAAAATTTTSTTSENNLRCPRCDSSNTKFCYYNNYNLTQPRHFCKTCRRYWTKGGALRNVPIGGGCRKSKTTTIGKSGAATKLKNLSSEMGQSSLFGGETLSSNPIIWAASQNSHILSLIRGNQTPNPNHLTSSVVEVSSSLFGSRAFGLDHLGPGHLPSYKSQTLASQGIDVEEVYQYHSHRLRTTSNYYYPEHAPVILGEMTSPSPSPSSATPILESATVATADQMAFWNPNISWPTNNGPYP